MATRKSRETWSPVHRNIFNPFRQIPRVDLPSRHRNAFNSFEDVPRDGYRSRQRSTFNAKRHRKRYRRHFISRESENIRKYPRFTERDNSQSPPRQLQSVIVVPPATRRLMELNQLKGNDAAQGPQRSARSKLKTDYWSASSDDTSMTDVEHDKFARLSNRIKSRKQRG
ncbi:uncharacterized protein LOC119660550 [Hermetia illucens]|uniref:uncharacterized protein LOC119660550 n=1 Tax=Hermetia illucens TaxID=343691 RepID=UPI0018CC65FA|nr:uncharacterized protein LOC119660550 [Hermetia illucens]